MLWGQIALPRGVGGYWKVDGCVQVAGRYMERQAGRIVGDWAGGRRVMSV